MAGNGKVRVMEPSNNRACQEHDKRASGDKDWGIVPRSISIHKNCSSGEKAEQRYCSQHHEVHGRKIRGDNSMSREMQRGKLKARNKEKPHRVISGEVSTKAPRSARGSSAALTEAVSTAGSTSTGENLKLSRVFAFVFD